MTVLERSRSFPTGFPSRRRGPGPFGSVLLVLAMLASAGAGASFTMAVMDDHPKRPLVVAAQPPAESTGAIAAHKDTAIPHNIWAPFVRAIPSVSFRRPQEENRPPAEPGTKSPVELASLGASSMIPSSNSSGIRSWRYQLQGIDPVAVARAPEDLAVIDYEGEEAPFSRADVARMQRKPDGSRRRVLAYLSIGEAEDYRFYWKAEWRTQPPAWLGRENSRWRHNYAVQFWDPAWQDIVFRYIDRILAAGFDGIYLDKVDAIRTMAHQTAMVDLVERISKSVKARRPGFMVMAQNGDVLLKQAKFRNAIDGFAREDLFYGEDGNGRRNGVEDLRDNIPPLKQLVAEGKPVFIVEYLQGKAAESARREIAAHGFVGLIVPRRALNAQ